MLKPALLRAALTAAVPWLARNPESLLVRVEAGHIRATMAGGLSYEYVYDLIALVTDYAGHADFLFTSALAWLRAAQPDMLLNHDRQDNGITFQADALDNEKYDIEIKFSGITERVIVTQKLAEGGKTEEAGEGENLEVPIPEGLTAPATIATIRHVAEPPVDPWPRVTRWHLYIGGELVRSDDVPPFEGPVTGEGG
ncbi:MAG: phage tail protein [Candidatus Accumulibacter sp.]|jgi:hypothetical protein|nr:phage tail protein [Accumulibacter sp.]